MPIASEAILPSRPIRPACSGACGQPNPDTPRNETKGERKSIAEGATAPIQGATSCAGDKPDS